MLNHKAFVKKAEKILASRTLAGHCFLFSADISEFQLVNRYYGVKSGDALLEAIESYLHQIPTIHAVERVLSDHFIFLVVTPEETSKEQIKAAYLRYAKEFLAAQRERYPDCSLKSPAECSPYPPAT